MQEIPVPNNTYRTSDTPLTTFLVDNTRLGMTGENHESVSRVVHKFAVSF